jgi:hypothetical protein
MEGGAWVSVDSVFPSEAETSPGEGLMGPWAEQLSRL